MKFLRFQRTFLEKSFGPGLGRIAPTFNAPKKHGIAVLFNYRNMLELRSKPCFKRLFEKSPLKIRKNFAPNNSILFCLKLLRFQRTFREKSFGQGFGAEAPTFNAQQKSTAMPCFFIFFGFINTYRPCLRLRQQLRLLRQPWGLSYLQQRLPL